ncbi:MAG: hypothetical protein AAGC81_09265 [Pseudomonadota bacterium]
MSETTAPRTCPRWVKVLLLFSLTVNVVVAGVLIGSHIRSNALRDGSWLVSMMPEEKRPAAEERIAKDKPRMLVLRKSRTRLSTVMIETMTAEEYSSEQLSATLEDHRALANQQRVLVHEQLVELFGTLDPAERKQAAEKMQDMFTRRSLKQR